MIGQAKALIPATIGIFILLLTGVMGIIDMPRVRQATVTAETRAIPQSENALVLDTQFRKEAAAAARDMGTSITADLTVDLKHQPSVKVANAIAMDRDPG